LKRIFSLAMMRNTRIYFFAFTYRFFYGRGGPRAKHTLRAVMLMA
jgi:hypothetical protein